MNLSGRILTGRWFPQPPCLLDLVTAAAPSQNMGPPTILIRANGEKHTVRRGSSLPEFLESSDLEPDRVVIERNGIALTPREAREVVLEHGDCLEIVRIVAGG